MTEVAHTPAQIPAPAPAATGARPDVHPRLLLGLLYAALTTAVVSSLGMLLVPTMAHEFDVTVSTAQWMLTVNLLVGAVSTPVMGRLADGAHQKRLLVVSLAVVVLGSVIAAAATSFAVLLVGRALQGLSYGIVPVTIAIARRHLTGDDLRRGIQALSVTVSTGIGIGYPLTGVLGSAFGFRSAFAFAAVFTLSAVLVVSLIAPARAAVTAARTSFDVLGALLLGVGLTGLLLALGQGEHWGWASALTLSVLVGALLVLAVWAWVELRVDRPLVNLRVFGSKDVLLANAAALGLGTAMYLSLSLASLVAQAPAVTGYGIELDLFWAGFVILPLAVGSFGSSRIVQALASSVSLATLLPFGAATMTIGAVQMYLLHDQLWHLMLGILLFGIGIGTAYAAMPSLIARSVEAHELGSAVSFNQVLRTIGGSVGSAASGAVLAAHMGAARYPTGRGIDLALLLGVVVGVVVLVALLVNRLLSRAAR